MKQEEIKNCPCCQSDQVRLENLNGEFYWVVCRGKCEMSGPTDCETPETAIGLWNRIRFAK